MLLRKTGGLITNFRVIRPWSYEPDFTVDILVGLFVCLFVCLFVRSYCECLLIAIEVFAQLLVQRLDGELAHCECVSLLGTCVLLYIRKEKNILTYICYVAMQLLKIQTSKVAKVPQVFP